MVYTQQTIGRDLDNWVSDIMYRSDSNIYIDKDGQMWENGRRVCHPTEIIVPNISPNSIITESLRKMHTPPQCPIPNPTLENFVKGSNVIEKKYDSTYNVTEIAHRCIYQIEQDGYDHIMKECHKYKTFYDTKSNAADFAVWLAYKKATDWGSMVLFKIKSVQDDNFKYILCNAENIQIDHSSIIISDNDNKDMIRIKQENLRSACFIQGTILQEDYVGYKRKDFGYFETKKDERPPKSELFCNLYPDDTLIGLNKSYIVDSGIKAVYNMAQPYDINFTFWASINSCDNIKNYDICKLYFMHIDGLVVGGMTENKELVINCIQKYINLLKDDISKIKRYLHKYILCEGFLEEEEDIYETIQSLGISRCK